MEWWVVCKWNGKLLVRLIWLWENVMKYRSDEKAFVDIWWWGYLVDVVALWSFAGIFLYKWFVVLYLLDMKTCKYCSVWGVPCIEMIKMRGGKPRKLLQLLRISCDKDVKVCFENYLSFRNLFMKCFAHFILYEMLCTTFELTCIVSLWGVCNHLQVCKSLLVVSSLMKIGFQW